MKTKIVTMAVLASVALIAPVQGGGHFGGGGGGFGGAGFGGGHVGGAHFSGNPTGYSGPRLSSIGGMRYPSVTQFRPRVVNSNIGSSVAARQSTRENINRGNGVAQFSNGGNRSITSAQHIRNGAGQVRNGNNTLRPDWRNHVFAQHSATWHHDWDRSRDHWWNGHHCRFINGGWVIFDVGFDPWWWWPCAGYEYGYPCDEAYYDY